MVSASAIAAACGIHYKAVVCLARAGAVPHAMVDGEMRFDADAAVAAIRTRKETKRCSNCGATRSLAEFRKRRHRSGAEGPSSECDECHKAHNQAARRRDAAAMGKVYRTREDICKQREQRKRSKAARYAAWLAGLEVARRAKRALTPAQKEQVRRESIKRKVQRQRERYSTDAEYQASIKAKKIRRKRATAGALVETVNREAVAQRDGWRCAICGGKVTRKTWSLDHIVPLSKGGSHSYRNCTLAHRKCNSARGIGRLPVQAPLFAHPSSA